MLRGKHVTLYGTCTFTNLNFACFVGSLPSFYRRINTQHRASGPLATAVQSPYHAADVEQAHETPVAHA